MLAFATAAIAIVLTLAILDEFSIIALFVLLILSTFSAIILWKSQRRNDSHKIKMNLKETAKTPSKSGSLRTKEL